MNFTKTMYRLLILLTLLTLPVKLVGEDLSEFWQNYFTEQNQNVQPNNQKQKLTSSESRHFFNQWFMGPLLVPSPTNADPKHPSFEPTVTLTADYGDFDNNWKIHKRDITTWSLLYTGYWQFSFFPQIGFDLIANVQSNYTKRASYTNFTDITLRVGYQIMRDQKVSGNYEPDLRLIFQEIFPTGHFQKLRPSREGVDITGQGSFQSGLIIAAEKSFAYHTKHAYNLYASFGYYLPANFRVKGLNLYGGNRETQGWVRPGSVFSAYFSGEMEISKRISIAFDTNYQQNLSGSFTGNQGVGSRTFVPQLVNFSIAFPEIEVTFTKNSGLMFGTWATFAGQNTPSFAAFFVAYLIFF